MNNYNLERFIEAQNNIYDEVIHELTEGQKWSHWIWYIFPQEKGLGRSYNSQYYGLDGEDEARAYLQHPVLTERLKECCRLVLSHAGTYDIRHIMGSHIDVIKLRSSMELFDSVCPDDVFAEVLNTYYK